MGLDCASGRTSLRTVKPFEGAESESRDAFERFGGGTAASRVLDPHERRLHEFRRGPHIKIGATSPSALASTSRRSNEDRSVRPAASFSSTDSGLSRPTSYIEPISLPTCGVAVQCAY